MFLDIMPMHGQYSLSQSSIGADSVVNWPFVMYGEPVPYPMFVVPLDTEYVVLSAPQPLPTLPEHYHHLRTSHQQYGLPRLVATRIAQDSDALLHHTHHRHSAHLLAQS